MEGRRVRFGDVLFDAGGGRLSVGGQPIELDRSRAAILKILLSEAGSEVDKDRLLEAGWPGRVVHENSLAKAISRLRQALGRDGELLETVHGYGYRLAAEPAEIAPPPQSQPAQAARPGPALVFSFLTLLSLGAAGVAVHSAATRTTDDPGIIKGEAADSIGRVLWVDDHPQNNIAERGYLESQKVAVYQVTTTDEALNLLAMYKYGAVISDMNRNDKPLDGITLVKAMRQRHDRTPFILYTVVPSQAQRTLLAQAGGQAATVTREQLYAAVLPRIRARWAARYRHD